MEEKRADEAGAKIDSALNGVCYGQRGRSAKKLHPRPSAGISCFSCELTTRPSEHTRNIIVADVSEIDSDATNS